MIATASNKVVKTVRPMSFTNKDALKLQPTYTEWHDLQVNDINRQPMHTQFFCFNVDEIGVNGNAMPDKTKSRNFLSLDGQWKFNWVENAGHHGHHGGGHHHSGGVPPGEAGDELLLLGLLGGGVLHQVQDLGHGGVVVLLGGPDPQHPGEVDTARDHVVTGGDVPG